MTKTADNKPRLLGRQRQLLALLDALGGRAGNLVPCRFGAFSFTSYADRRKLIGHGLLVDDDEHWELTAEGRRVVGAALDMDMQALSVDTRACVATNS